MLKFFLFAIISSSILFAKVDINSASKEELTKIKGIGETKAQAIIEYREKKCFERIEDLDLVKGFGAKTIELIKNEIEIKPCTKDNNSTAIKK